jgi:tRNA 2-thiouridine synthesizing protein D
MKFSLIILGAPASDQCASTALRFARAAIDSGHQIFKIFFYNDGVHNASNLITPPQGELDIPEQWQSLALENKIEMVPCIASSLRRGVLNTEEANRFEKACANMNETAFNLSGLGELIDATINSDRIITFGR